jgi:hypothetical protein
MDGVIETAKETEQGMRNIAMDAVTHTDRATAVPAPALQRLMHTKRIARRQLLTVRGNIASLV